MKYEMRFKELMADTKKGFSIGLILSAIIVALMFSSVGKIKIFEYIYTVIGMDIIIGPIASIIISAKTGTKENVNIAGRTIFSSIIDMCFCGIFSLNPIFMVFSIIKLAIGLFIMIPVCVFMVLSYFCSLIYYGFMYFLEKNGRL